MKEILKCILWSFIIVIVSCGKQTTILHHFPINSNDIINDTLAVFTPSISYDGDGSLYFSVQKPAVIELYEIENVKVENCELIYSAILKAEHWKGNCYLEMWCFIDGLGYFSRSLDKTITLDTNWKMISTPFLLKKGQVAEKIKLNIVADGIGEIWLDSIEVKKKK
jgi:hypothetical protein